MAHIVLGVDLGAQTNKLARFETGFRKAALLEVRVLPAPPLPSVTGGVSAIAAAERIGSQLRALKAQLAADPVLADEIALGLPGDLLTLRTLDLPFSDPRRIEQVLGYELESQVLQPLDELVIDHVIVGPQGTDTRVLAVAAPRTIVDAVVKVAAELDLPIRLIGASPLACAGLAPSGPPSLVVDMGHERTTVCVVRGGRPETGRSISRGGRHLTDAVAAAFRIDAEAAERAKVEAGFLAHEAMQPQSPSQQRMDACLRDALKPLVRDLRQTLAAHRATSASSGESPTRLLLTGGSSRLPGLAEHLAEELGLPVSPLPWNGGEGWSEIDANDRDRVAGAVGMALGAAGAPQVNFRRGEFAFRSDFSFLRGKATSFAVALLAVLACAAINAYASLRGLRQEQEQLSARLKRETTELFGQERTDAKTISEELKGGPKASGAPPIPTVTAFDVLDEISRAAPPREKVKLDLLELDIKPKKLYLKATAETNQQMDDLADALSKIDCFEEVQKGKSRTVTGTTVDKDGKETKTELKEFTLNVVTTCP